MAANEHAAHISAAAASEARSSAPPPCFLRLSEPMPYYCCYTAQGRCMAMPNCVPRPRSSEAARPTSGSVLARTARAFAGCCVDKAKCCMLQGSVGRGSTAPTSMSARGASLQADEVARGGQLAASAHVHAAHVLPSAAAHGCAAAGVQAVKGGLPLWQRVMRMQAGPWGMAGALRWRPLGAPAGQAAARPRSAAT